jgi:hypothetical protein
MKTCNSLFQLASSFCSCDARCRLQVFLVYLSYRIWAKLRSKVSVMCVYNKECVCNNAKLRLGLSVVCMCVRALMSFFQETDTCHGRLHFSGYFAVQVSACGSAISLRLLLWLHVASDNNILPFLWQGKVCKIYEGLHNIPARAECFHPFKTGKGQPFSIVLVSAEHSCVYCVLPSIWDGQRLAILISPSVKCSVRSVCVCICAEGIVSHILLCLFTFFRHYCGSTCLILARNRYMSWQIPFLLLVHSTAIP